QRCFYCYESRLEMTAQMAVKHGFEAFSSTLLVSPYQNQEAIRKIGEQIAQKYQIDFYFYDFRPFFRQGQQQARALGLYMQKYCGCIYSEKERYLKVKI
ncbi:MAG: epoxyqueuosine reductase QueH, partial [Clostridiales bacterium]